MGNYLTSPNKKKRTTIGREKNYQYAISSM